MIPRRKTTVPGVPPDVVDRPELFAGFDAPGAPGVGLVSAPAGYGKTLALAGWAAGHARTAWVSLDRHDDAHLLWSAILAALVRDPGARAEVHDLAPPRGADDRDFLARFCDALDVPDPPITLVLDDVHEVGDAAAMGELRSLVLYRPRGLRLLLSSRFDPPLSLPRLRLEGRLWDLRADRLAFSPAETALLAERAGLTLSADETRRLQQQTGGWAAGLRLAVQAMRKAESPEAFLAAFSGDDRSVADYLVGEVLDILPAPIREFLTLASITDPLPGALAVEITGREDAVEVLERLERETSLCEELAGDQHEYRILELLRTYLFAELHRRRPVLAAELHGRAARWWAARDAPVAALEHARRGDDPALLAELLDRFALRLALTGNHAPLRRVLASAPGEGPPGGAPTTAATALGTGLVLDAEDLRTLRAAVADVLTAGSPDGPVLAVLEALDRGLGDLLTTDLDGARDGLEEALGIACRHGFDFAAVQCRTLLAYVAAVQGDHVGARTLSGEALGEGVAAPAPRAPWEPSAWVTLAHVLHAYAALQQGDPETARSSTETALSRPAETVGPTLRYALRVVGGAARTDEGEPADGLAEIRRARTELAGHPLPARLEAIAALFEHRAALRLGHPAGATDGASGLAGRAGASAEVALLTAWTELDRDRAGSASARVAGIVAGTQVPLLPHVVVEAQVVQATVDVRAGDVAAARRCLRAALATAGPLDLVRPFVQAGEEVGELLAEHQQGDEPFAARVRAAQRTAGEPPANARLTDRELAVLELLPSLMSSDDIAAALSVSRSTVKTHVQTIYSKLGVQSRRSAVQAARARGLL